MTSLSHIFPSDYLNPPTDADLQYEVQDLLRRTDYPPQLLTKIDAMQCPYYKEALMQCLKHMWHTLVEKRDPRTGYEDSNGCWIPYWMEAEQVMKQYCRRYQTEQYGYTYATHTAEPPIEQAPMPVAEPPAEPPAQEAPKTVSHIASQVKTAIKQALYELAATTPPPLQSMTINIHIHNHHYYSTVGQVTDSVNKQINNQL